MKILVLNCGSSSLKFQVIDAETEKRLAKGLCERIGIAGSRVIYTKTGEDKKKMEVSMPNHKEAILQMLKVLQDEKTGVISELSEIGAVGHRIVHGGEKFSKATLITSEVKATIRECSALAPLHNPANLIGVEACQALMPDIPMVAVFDTAFHQTMPEEAYLYGIPYSYYEKYRLRRYGFHGTSHDYVSERAAEILGKKREDCKIIVCHLGNGASVSAVKNGQCVDTSMGLTPLEGLVMGTRSGDIDPAVIEFIAHKEGRTIDEIMNILNKESGVLGLSDGFSPDFRDLERAYFEGRPEAVRAIRTFSRRVAKNIGAYAAVMNGVDVLCFTAGVGENSPIIRSLICEYLGFLGVHLDEDKNGIYGQEEIISAENAPVTVMVVPTNEELAIARETARLVKG